MLALWIALLALLVAPLGLADPTPSLLFSPFFLPRRFDLLLERLCLGRQLDEPPDPIYIVDLRVC